MYKQLIFCYFIFNVITLTLTKFDTPPFLYGRSSNKSFRKEWRVTNTILQQCGRGGRLKFPGKVVKGVKSKFVPQTDTGRLVEYTKAYG